MTTAIACLIAPLLVTTSSVVTFNHEQIAPGVHVVRSLEPLGLANHSNAVFIVNDNDVVLVDTQFTRKRTLEVLKIVRGEADPPIGVLINTHWHDDHTFGNQVIQSANPSVEIIAHVNTKRDMAGIGVVNRDQQVAGGKDALAMFRRYLGENTSFDGSVLSPSERIAYDSTIRIVEQYLAEIADFKLTLPTRTFEDRLVLKRGKRTIEIRYLGPAVTEGDAVVYLPEDGVLVAGDIVNHPFPFAYRCHVSGWIQALDAIRRMNPRIVVPGHGEVLRGIAHVERLTALFTSIRDQAAAAVERGETLEQARASIDVRSLREPLVANDEMLGFLFDNFFVGPAVQSAYNEATSR